MSSNYNVSDFHQNKEEFDIYNGSCGDLLSEDDHEDDNDDSDNHANHVVTGQQVFEGCKVSVISQV